MSQWGNRSRAGVPGEGGECRERPSDANGPGPPISRRIGRTESWSAAPGAPDIGERVIDEIALEDWTATIEQHSRVSPAGGARARSSGIAKNAGEVPEQTVRAGRAPGHCRRC